MRAWMAAAVAVVAAAPVSVEARRRGVEERYWTEAKTERIHKERSVLREVAKRAMPAVVSITTTQEATKPEDEQTGLGSGFIIHQDGFILTSAHVIEGAKDIRVSLLTADGFTREYDASVVGVDKPTDFALLKIKADHKLPVLPFGRSQDVDIADWVVVIGNPFGLGHSVSVGVVSFKGRTDVTPSGLDGYFDYIQTDAAINPGNSGGPVLDLNGNVVAIANAVNVSGQGIGFAIPVEVAKSVIPPLVRDGKVIRGWVGVSIEDVTPEAAEAFGIPLQRGVLVSDVSADSPAAKAGLLPGDVIVGVDGKETLRSHALRWRVSTKGVGKRVRLDVEREGRRIHVDVTLGAMPELVKNDLATDHGPGLGSGGGGTAGDGATGQATTGPTRLGIGTTVTEVDAQSAYVAGLDGTYGALVNTVEPNSVGEAAGFLSGDIVLKVNKTPVASREELVAALNGVPSGEWVRVFIRRSNETHALTFKKP